MLRSESCRAIAMETERPYEVKSSDGRWEVWDESARVVMICRDESDATNYAVLLNEAYRRGYKVGYRAGRRLE